jgi:hypothetical protein
LELIRQARETVTAREEQLKKEEEDIKRKEEEFLERKKESRDLLGETLKREMAASSSNSLSFEIWLQLISRFPLR